MNYFYHISQSSAEDTWNSLLATCHKVLQKDGYFRSETGNDQTIIPPPPKKNLKTFRCTRRLQFWKKCQKIHAKSPINSLNVQKTWAKFLHSRETS